jgi:low affinity Fe/Cu permease
MVFLIQHAQNRDSKAINLKLNELIRALHSAHNELIDVEKLSDEDLQRLQQRYESIRARSGDRPER